MRPLEGIRVLDLSVHLSGPYASAIMADMGADVIRIERPGGDDDRRLGFELYNGASTIFLSRARNKRSLTLNLHHPEGKEIFQKLVKESDVLLENFGPATAKGLGMDYQSMKQINPRLIMASVSGYGSWGPNKNKTAFDAVAQAASGAMMYCGFPDDDRPARSAVTWVDYSTALHAAVGILLALRHRDQTGKGQHVDISMCDDAVSVVGMQGIYADYLLTGIVREKTGNRSPYVYSDTFRCKDGWVFLHLGRDANWRRFCKLIGRPELIDDPRFDEDAKRAANNKLVDEIVIGWIGDKSCKEVSDTLESVRIPCQKVNNIPDVVVDPHVKARDMIVEVDQPGVGKVPIPGIVIKMSESPGEIKTPAPGLGEHNEEILKGLGYDSKAMERLKTEGII